MDLQTSRRTLLRMIGGVSVAHAFSGAPAAVRSADAGIIDLKVEGGRTSRVTHWSAASRRGTILFSHGALSSPTKYDPLILPWVAAGYDVWAPLHVDSTDHPDTRAFPGLASWRARIEDMQALSRHFDGERYIAAGHSYGGLVALTLGGASAAVPQGLKEPLKDARARAVVAFSPPGATPGLVDAAGYATLAVPALIQTGTHDTPPAAPGAKVDSDSWRRHLLAYDSAPADGNRYALVLDEVDHYFGGLICRPELPGPKQTAQMEQAVAVSRLFLDAYGLRDGKARRTLNAQLSEKRPFMLLHK